MCRGHGLRRASRSFATSTRSILGNVSRDFTWGGIYENLLISTAFGGGHQYNILAKTLAWSKDGKTLTVTVQPNVKWSDGKPLTTGTSSTASRSARTTSRRPDRLRRGNSNIASIKLAVQGKVAIRLKQVDSTFVGVDAARTSDRAAAHLVEGHGHHEVPEPEPGRLGAVHRVTRFNAQDYVLSKNPNYWLKGLPKIPCVERIAAAPTTRRCSRS